jgi:hypothetical protein
MFYILSFLFATLNGTSVDATSEFCMTAMLVLLMIRNLKVKKKLSLMA